MNPRRFTFLAIALLLFIIWLLLGSTTCRPPANSCVDDVVTLEYGSYCKPLKTTARQLEKASDLGSQLPDFCDHAGGKSRVFKVAAPEAEVLYMHLYLNFPGKVTVSFIGTHCDGEYQLLNDCTTATTTAVVGAFSVNTAGFSTVYIRLTYSGTGGYIPGDRPTDELMLAVFEAAPDDFEIIGRKGEPTLFRGCGNETNRIILTPGSGDISPLEVAQASGLPYQTCACSDGSLVTISAPAGVDINEVKPKIKEKDSKVDTVNMTIDRLFSSPRIGLIDSLKSENEYGTIASNPCLQLRLPFVEGSRPSVKVAIVDSGVDAATHAAIFNPLKSNGNQISCISSSNLGADLLRGDDTPEDEIGHGTAVAGVIMSGFKSAANLELMHNKFFGPDGGTLFDAICASYAGINAGSHLLHFSWGFESDETPEALIALLEYAKKKDVIVVVSTGNDSLNLDGGTIRYWPALAASQFENMIAVSAYEGGLQSMPITLSDWSNFGTTSNAVAAFYTAQSLQMGNTDRAYAFGTSIAAPMVSRQLAQLRGNQPGDKASDIINQFLSNHTKTDTGLNSLVNNEKFLPLPNPASGCNTP